MKCVIVIDGDSADELFAVGVKDLMNDLLPKQMFVKKKDIVKCRFEEIRRDGKVCSLMDVMDGKPYTVASDPDNFERKRR